MSNRNYNFYNSLNIGKVAVDAVCAFLQRQTQHLALINVEDIDTYQHQGVDLIWTVKTEEGSSRLIKVEVKADTYYDTGNFYLETISNMTKGTPGCFVSSCADVYAYFFVGVSILYWIPLKEAQEWFRTHQERFPIRETSTGKAGEHFYKTQGRLVPRQVFLTEVGDTRRISL